MTQVWLKLLHLLGDRGGDLRMAVARRGHGDTGAEVDVAITFDIPQFGALGALDVNRRDIALAARHGVVLARLPVLVAAGLLR